MIGRKQRASNDAWISAMASIEDVVSKDDLEALTASTVEDILGKVGTSDAAYAWSGGKDSVVLGHICQQAGITKSMMGICDLEYPAFMAWVNAHKPAGCEIINTHQDLDWLSKHQEMLFPTDSKVTSRWFSIVQHRAQRIYAKNQNTDILILGRRLADGNYVGKGSNIYTDGKGVTRYSPLSGWSHEHVLAYIHYNRLELPPIYAWHNGYVCGTHPWPARPYTCNTMQGWREIYDIDPEIVKSAANVIESAQAFLDTEVQA